MLTPVEARTIMKPHPLTALALLALACLWLPSKAPLAEIYKRVLPDGSVVYSDEPSPGAERVELPPPQTIPAPPPPAAPATPRAGQRKTEEAVDYRLVKITQPGNDAQIRENSGRVEISVQVEPPLQNRAGHRLVLMMDGKEVARSNGNLHFVLENVDRGTHELVAEIQDRKGRRLKRSRTVLFHLFRYSRLQGSHPGN